MMALQIEERKRLPLLYPEQREHMRRARPTAILFREGETTTISNNSGMGL